MKLSHTQKRQAILRQAALDYPDSYEEFPWGEMAVKVSGKTFLFLGADEREVSFSVKLPRSNGEALAMEFTEPTHYGLGKSGWVTATIKEKTPFPLDTIRSWIDESYRAIAPKKLIAQLDGTVKEAQPVQKSKRSPAAADRKVNTVTKKKKT